MKKWWILILFGCLLLGLTINPVVAVFAILIALLVFWFVQMRRINFLLAKIQEGVQKLQAIFHKWSPKKQKPD